MGEPKKPPSNAGKSVGRETMPDDPERGDRIAGLMKTRGHNVSSLARAAGRDRSQVYRWIDGKSMGPDVVGELAIALETSRTYLMTGEQPDGFTPGLFEVRAAVNQLDEKLDALSLQVKILLSEQRFSQPDEQQTEKHPEHGRGGQG